MPVQNFTPLQETRIRHHLGYMQKLRPQESPFFDSVYLFAFNLTSEVVYNVVGNFALPPVLDDPDGINDLYLHDQRLASPYSLLWECETGFRAMSPSNIDASLFVKQAGKVTLLADELENRKQLYLYWCGELAKHLDLKGNFAEDELSTIYR